MKTDDWDTFIDRLEAHFTANLYAPDKPIGKKYEALTELEMSFQSSKTREFRVNRKFAAKLKRLSLHCNFTDSKTAIRDPLVCGLSDHNIRVELFKKKELTFDKAIEEGTSTQSRMP